MGLKTDLHQDLFWYAECRGYGVIEVSSESVRRVYDAIAKWAFHVNIINYIKIENEAKVENPFTV